VTRGYLFDTSVLSALAPDRPAPPNAFSAWLEARGDRLFLPSIVVVEVQQGVCKLRRQGASERAARLSAWLDRLVDTFSERVIALDAGIGRVAGELSDAATANGAHPGLADVLIAATGRARSLLILTRNARHFSALGVPFADPFDALPD
jgi:predicted nucleic acid-binding protein